MFSNNRHGASFDVLYSQQDQKRQKSLFHLQIFYLKLSGQMPFDLEMHIPRRWKRAAKCLAKLYCAFTVLSIVHLALLYVKTTYDMLQTGELKAITDTFCNATIFTFASFETCYWQWRSKSLHSFLANVSAQHRHHSVFGLTFVNAKASYSLAYKMTLYWLNSCFVGVVVLALSPLLLGLHTLPLKCWHPFNPMQPIIYELTYAYQVWCQLIMGCIYGSGSALFFSIIIIMLGQFDVLYCSLKNLDYHGHLLSGADLKHLEKLQAELLQGHKEELNQYMVSKEYPTDLTVFEGRFRPKEQTLKNALHQSLTECVCMHQFILKSCSKLEQLFHIYCLLKSLQLTLQLCLLVFAGVMTQSSTMQTFNMVQYVSLILIELLLLTYFSQLLRTHSVRGGEALFRSQWFSYATGMRKDILIFLINTQHAANLTAGKFFLMDVQRLRMVITQAFSFLTLLRKLAEKNGQVNI